MVPARVKPDVRTRQTLAARRSRHAGASHAAASARRGEREHLELFIAFDDPCSAVAVIDLSTRLAGRPVEIVPLPVISRGIEGDPAVGQKREYAITDARRLARRSGMTLARETPLRAADTAFLAEWVAAIRPGAESLAFTIAALRRLWFEGDGPVERNPFLDLWREHVGSEPRRDPAAVRATEKRMTRRGPYETPAAWIAGRWYFAHDRPGQICEWLDELGWPVR
jgi:2-hydroxychromene-2-carboxylate isomerase